MFELTRISIINWYLVGARDIDLAGNAGVIGENRSGKSALLDAVQTVMTGNNNLYNRLNGSAQDDGKKRSERSVKDYCLGKVIPNQPPQRKSCRDATPSTRLRRLQIPLRDPPQLPSNDPRSRLPLVLPQPPTARPAAAAYRAPRLPEVPRRSRLPHGRRSTDAIRHRHAMGPAAGALPDAQTPTRGGNCHRPRRRRTSGHGSAHTSRRTGLAARAIPGRPSAPRTVPKDALQEFRPQSPAPLPAPRTPPHCPLHGPAPTARSTGPVPLPAPWAPAHAPPQGRRRPGPAPPLTPWRSGPHTPRPTRPCRPRCPAPQTKTHDAGSPRGHDGRSQATFWPHGSIAAPRATTAADAMSRCATCRGQAQGSAWRRSDRAILPARSRHRPTTQRRPRCSTAMRPRSERGGRPTGHGHFPCAPAAAQPRRAIRLPQSARAAGPRIDLSSGRWPRTRSLKAPHHSTPSRLPCCSVMNLFASPVAATYQNQV